MHFSFYYVRFMIILSRFEYIVSPLSVSPPAIDDFSSPITESAPVYYIYEVFLAGRAKLIALFGIINYFFFIVELEA